jgi:hypothetical protein
VERISGWALDGVFVALAGWGSILKQWQPEHDRFFPPLMLMLVLRLVSGVTRKAVSAWLEALMVIAVLHFAVPMSGVGVEFFVIGAVVLAVAGIVASRGFSRITTP